MFSRLLYCTPFFISSISVLIAAIFAARRHKARGAWYLIVMCLSAADYAVFEGLRYLTTDLQTDMVMTYVQYLGVAFLIPSAILFSLSVFSPENRSIQIALPLLSFLAVATIALAWTDPLHHLVYADVRFVHDGPFPMREYTPGIFWWVIVAYHYLLMVAFTLLLIHVFRTSSGLHRIQAGLFLAGAACVWFFHAVFIAGFSPVPHMDVSPLAFILVAVSMVVGFVRYNLLDVLPIARSEIFRKLLDPIVVLDKGNHILDLNPSAEKLLSVRSHNLFGRDIGNIFDRHPVALQSLRKGDEREIGLVLDGMQHHFLLRFSPIFNRRGQLIGRIVIFQDISKRKQAEKALRKAERLRGILEMAGAVCHDLSQPAMASGGYAELIRSGLSENDPLYGPLTTLVEQVEKLGDINKKLMLITQENSEKKKNNGVTKG